MILRPVGAADADHLYRVFASTRAAELCLTGLPTAQLDALLRLQFTAQDRQYRAAHPDAQHSVITVDGEDAGQLWVARERDAIHLLDIALLPEHQGGGVGSTLVRRLQEEAATSARWLRLHVARTSPAVALYLRLGFRSMGGDGVYREMAWTAVTAAEAAG
ncbi:MAG TPA: GNAT family N-acetyltransferase [Candidatus Dormibacteraeota bacterium]